MRLCDGTLEAATAEGVSSHLEVCPECRNEVARLRDRQTAPAFLSNLTDQIRQWEAQRDQTPEGRAELRRKLILELTPFIGDAAAAKLLATVSEDGRNLLSTLEPVLARFLGISAATELVNHLVDAAIY